LKAHRHDELKADRLQLDIPVLLPSLPDEADACVGRLVGELEGRDGIDRVHVLPAFGVMTSDLPPRLRLGKGTVTITVCSVMLHPSDPYWS
jgi:hypothetical protein